MNKRKQIILVIAVLLVAFCSFVYLKKQFFSPSKPKEESRKETLVFDSSLKDITLTKDGRYVLVSPKDVNWQSNDILRAPSRHASRAGLSVRPMELK